MSAQPTSRNVRGLMLGASTAAFVAVTAFTAAPAFAIDWDAYTTSETANAAPSANGKALSVTAGGNLSVAGTAVTNTDKTGTSIVVNTTDATKGISSTGNNSTVSVSGTGVVDTITVTKGTITGVSTTGTIGTITLDHDQSTAPVSTTIATAANGTISNTGAGGNAIYIGKVNTTINNLGTIFATNNASSVGINVASSSGSTVIINNSGAINAGALGKAINIGANTKATITQTAGTVTGAVVLGDTATTTLAVNGGTIAGDVTMNQAGQLITLGGGQINGKIDGAGLVVANANYTSNGNIGSTAGITKLTINDGKTFNAATNNNSIKATNVVIGSGAAGTAVLTLGTGAVTGAIDGDAAGKGTLNFNGSQTTSASDIGGTNALGTVNVATGATVNANANNTVIKATTVNIGGTLQLGTSSVTGAIEGLTAGAGTLKISGANTLAGTVGATRGLAAVTVDDGITLALGNNTVKATNVSVGNGSTVTVGTGAITGSVNGSAAGKGTVTFTENYTTAGTFGATNQLAKINFGNGADTINVGHSISAAANEIANGGIVNLNSGANLLGTIDGAAGNQGTLNVKTTYGNASKIGNTNALSALTVGTGGILNVGADIKANTVTANNTGRINFGSTARTITGDLTAANTAIIDAGSKTHTVSGTFATAATNTINTTINSATANDSGRIAAGTANIAAGTTINANVVATNFIAAGTKYKVLTGTGAHTNAATITDNSYVLNFTEDLTTNDERSLVAVRANSYTVAATTTNEKSVGTALTNIGTTGTGELAQFQARLDNATSAAQVEAALQEVTPQTDNSLTTQTLTTTSQSLDVVGSRLSDLRAGIDNSTGMASGNGIADRGVWFQGFGTTAEQELRKGVFGYDADTYGAAIGADTALNSNTRVGVSLSYANTEIDSNGGAAKQTDVDSYQINAYATHDLNNGWFLDGLLGVAWHDFESTRFITNPALVARADFDGLTYTARAGTGYRYNLGNGWDMTPKASLTYYHNDLDSYSETGAGLLNLTVDNDNTQALIGSIGADFGFTAREAGLLIRPVLRLAYSYDFIGDEQATTTRFTGAGASFNTNGADVAQSIFNIGAGVNVLRSDNISFTADYDYEHREDYGAHSGVLRARFGF